LRPVPPPAAHPAAGLAGAWPATRDHAASSVPPSTIRAIPPSPVIVAPAKPGRVRSFEPSDVITTSSWPSSLSTRSTARLTPVLVTTAYFTRLPPLAGGPT